MASPAEILDWSGRRLAQALGPNWQWLKSRHALVRKERTRTDMIELEPTSRSRAGQGTWAYLRVTVRDTALGRWRKEQGEHVLQVRDLIWTTPFINIDPTLYFIELEGRLHETGSGSVRYILLEELERRLPADVVPNLDLFQAATSVAQQLPDSWLVFIGPAIEWAAWSGADTAAQQLAARTVARLNVRERASYEEARAASMAGGPPPFPLGSAGAGWAAGRLDLARGL